MRHRGSGDPASSTTIRQRRLRASARAAASCGRRSSAAGFNIDVLAYDDKALGDCEPGDRLALGFQA
jgi:hypothetical protein